MSYNQNRRTNNSNRNGGGGGNRFGGGKRGGYSGGSGKQSIVPLDENNPMVQCFREYARELDEKQDRYERIVKCSRDITIESKRIIFLLHTVDAKKHNQSKVCDEAKNRLDKLCQTHFCTIAKELHGLDSYQYARAYTNGLQEFIEAYTFLEYISSESISHWKSIQDQLTYNVAPADLAKQKTDSKDENEDPKDYSTVDANENKDKIQINFLLPPLDFVLGVGDLSGEVMRKCINSLGSGDVESCFDHRRFLQELYNGFFSVGNAWSRDFTQKLYTLKQSLMKCEKVCYNVKVRGNEAAKWCSTDDCGLVKEEDEGVFL